MKKRYWFIIILMTGLYNTLYAQSAFLDADILKKNIENNTLKINEDVESILAVYFPDVNSTEDLNDTLTNNPFLDFIMVTEKYDRKEPSIAFYNDKSLKIEGGLDVTTYADALARFMVARAKQELSIAFFERLQNHIKEDTELGILFPQTRNLLTSIGEDIYQFNVYLTSLRDVFRLDLENIYTNLPDLINNKKYETHFKNFPELKAIFETSLIILNGLSNEKHPGEVLNELSFNEFTGSDTTNVKGALQTIQFLSNSLRALEDSGTYWISRSEFDEDIVTIRIYLGLLYQKEKIAKEGEEIVLDGKRLHELLGSMAENKEELESNLGEYRKFYNQFLSHTALIEDYLEEIKNINADERTYHDYYKYFRTTLDIFDEIHAFSKIHEISVATDSNLAKFTHTVYRLNDLYLSIKGQNYGSSIAFTISILDTLLADRFDGRDQFFRYGSFIANVATATNSEEVQKIIEATVLPPGSYRAKRNSSATVSISSYLGANILLTKPDRFDAGRAINNHVGFYAPVGIEGSISPNCLNNANLSLFLSLIDLGAITRYRLNESDGTIDSTIELGSIISPGVSFIVGLPLGPLSLGVSYSSQPSLQYDDTNGFITIDRDEKKFGFSFSLTVDMPLFNVYMKPK